MATEEQVSEEMLRRTINYHWELVSPDLFDRLERVREDRDLSEEKMVLLVRQSLGSTIADGYEEWLRDD